MDKWTRLRYLEYLASQIGNVLDEAGIYLTKETVLALIILAYRGIKRLNPKLTPEQVKKTIITLVEDYSILDTKLEG